MICNRDNENSVCVCVCVLYYSSHDNVVCYRKVIIIIYKGATLLETGQRVHMS